jgi:hypothetical protein
MRRPLLALCTVLLGVTLMSANCGGKKAGDGSTPGATTTKDSTATDTTP